MWSTFIYGNPRGFYVYENVDESFRAYFRKLYDSSGEGRYMSIDRFPNGLTMLLVIIMLFCLKDCGCSCSNNETHDVEHVENEPSEQHFTETITTHTIVTDKEDKSLDNETERNVVAIVEEKKEDNIEVNANTEVRENIIETNDTRGQNKVDDFDENYIRKEVLTNLNVGRESFVNDYFKSLQGDNQTLIKWLCIAAICDIINKTDIDSEAKKTLIKSCQKSRNVSIDDIKTELFDNVDFKKAHEQTDGFNGILTCLNEIIVFKDVK